MLFHDLLLLFLFMPFFSLELFEIKGDPTYSVKIQSNDLTLLFVSLFLPF